MPLGNNGGYESVGGAGFSGNMGSPTYLANFNHIGAQDDLKMSHDQYDVFVNQEWVGKKDVLTQTDDPMDLEEFLIHQGFTDFTTTVEGNRIRIGAQDPEFQKMKEILGTYLQIR